MALTEGRIRMRLLGHGRPSAVQWYFLSGSAAFLQALALRDSPFALPGFSDELAFRPGISVSARL
ncbi:MAG: hypothetical protein OXI87_10320 [Albidovulum sp.]|nr:hypothetical protein [Albidovulum sp.]MDE0305264.1 hypothetical protein [Albidovulum sp.]